jgi:glycine/D-amino acid oxidase-like deaminating enzyme
VNAANVATQARVVIIGGGVIGCSIAYHLVKLGCSDVVLLSGSDGAASRRSVTDCQGAAAARHQHRRDPASINQALSPQGHLS